MEDFYFINIYRISGIICALILSSRPLDSICYYNTDFRVQPKKPVDKNELCKRYLEIKPNKLWYKASETQYPLVKWAPGYRYPMIQAQAIGSATSREEYEDRCLHR